MFCLFPMDGTPPPRHRRNSFLPGWLLQPVLYAALFGGTLLAMDYVIHAARPSDARPFTVSDEVEGKARGLFKDARGREPSVDELEALRCVVQRDWSDAIAARQCTAAVGALARVHAVR
jgi:hypothetical protein